MCVLENKTGFLNPIDIIYSGSFLVRKLVVIYPEYHIYVVDKLDYCGSLHNLKSVSEFPNYTFIKVNLFFTLFLWHPAID